MVLDKSRQVSKKEWPQKPPADIKRNIIKQNKKAATTAVGPWP